MRGRSRGGSGGGGGGGGGKGPNPLTRSYESNGPDVKIRGTAGTIADKYVQLSRDALTAGDPVGAENYMQHAEHYYRLLAAAQAQYQPHQTFVRADADDFSDLDFDGEGEPIEQNGQLYGANGQPQPHHQGGQPQQNNGYQNRQQNGSNGQYSGGQPRNDGRYDGRNDNRYDRRDGQNNGGQQNNGGRRDNGYRSDNPQQGQPRQDQPRNDQQPRQDQFGQDQSRQDQPRQDQPRQDAVQASEAPAPAPAPRSDRRSRAPRQSERDDAAEAPGGLPAFITGGASAAPAAVAPAAPAPEVPEAPLAPSAAAPEPAPAAEPVEASATETAEDGDPRENHTPSSRGRRRRYGRSRTAAGEEGADAPAPQTEGASE